MPFSFTPSMSPTSQAMRTSYSAPWISVQWATRWREAATARSRTLPMICASSPEMPKSSTRLGASTILRPTSLRPGGSNISPGLRRLSSSTRLTGTSTLRRTMRPRSMLSMTRMRHPRWTGTASVPYLSCLSLNNQDQAQPAGGRVDLIRNKVRTLQGCPRHWSRMEASLVRRTGWGHFQRDQIGRKLCLHLSGKVCTSFHFALFC
jgi:hypothetical protein